MFSSSCKRGRNGSGPDKQTTCSQCLPTRLTKMQTEIHETNMKVKQKILKTVRSIRTVDIPFKINMNMKQNGNCDWFISCAELENFSNLVIFQIELEITNHSSTMQQIVVYISLAA